MQMNILLKAKRITLKELIINLNKNTLIFISNCNFSLLLKIKIIIRVEIYAF